ncbi:hypothetical protein ACHWQZ_G013973 [Mnemiopsis leidyi]
MRLSVVAAILVAVMLLSGSTEGGKLEKDNPSHRSLSDKLDKKHGGKPLYEKFVRPVVHGVYHAARGIKSGNGAEWDRAKDQFSKVGSGQQRTDYLKTGKKGK